MTAPRVFVSHAHEDRARAEPLARALRDLGVDAWFDQWEIQPGDSLINKIFEEGLKECKVFLVLLSNASVRSRWVREELDAAMIRRIEGATRVVPVLLEPCEIPIALRPLLWVDLGDGTEQAAKRIADVAFGRREVPPIVPPPSRVSFAVPGLTEIGARLAVALAPFLDVPPDRATAFTGEQLAKMVQMTPAELNDAVDELESRGLVQVEHFIGTAPYEFGIVEPTYALASQLRGTPALSYDPEQDLLTVAAAIVAKASLTGDQLVSMTGLSVSRINHAVTHLEDYGLIDARHYMGTSPFGFASVQATPATRRFVAENAK